MSYCRWSSDDFQCDLYVYEDVAGGFMIHVAARARRPPAETRPPPIGRWWERSDEGIEDFTARSKAVEAWLDSAPWQDIGLPHDGQSILTEDAVSCADEVERLRGLGYRVPDGVIEALREEASETTDQEPHHAD